MKILTLLLLTIFLGKGCEDDQQDLKTAVIEYTANTRGFYQKIVIREQAFFVSTSRDETALPALVPISDADWKELLEAFKEVELEGLPNLKAPTEKRFYDGAAIAELTIKYQEKVYTSSSFDHGFPPAEIEKLVKKITSLATVK
ncbi:MAG TPA: hypothetical protein VF581_01455 [Flavobacterium sp.]|jgi:hypothetical protein